MRAVQLTAFGNPVDGPGNCRQNRPSNGAGGGDDRLRPGAHTSGRDLPPFRYQRRCRACATRRKDPSRRRRMIYLTFDMASAARRREGGLRPISIRDTATQCLKLRDKRTQRTPRSVAFDPLPTCHTSGRCYNLVFGTVKLQTPPIAGNRHGAALCSGSRTGSKSSACPRMRGDLLKIELISPFFPN